MRVFGKYIRVHVQNICLFIVISFPRLVLFAKECKSNPDEVPTDIAPPHTRHLSPSYVKRDVGTQNLTNTGYLFDFIIIIIIIIIIYCKCNWVVIRWQ